MFRNLSAVDCGLEIITPTERLEQGESDRVHWLADFWLVVCQLAEVSFVWLGFVGNFQESKIVSGIVDWIFVEKFQF